MDTNSGSFDFVKEFARDSKDILAGLREQFEKERHLAIDGEVTGSQLNFAIQDLQAVKGSAEFLGLETAMDICGAIEAIFRSMTGHLHVSEDDMDLLHRLLEKMDDFFLHLEKDGQGPEIEHQAQDIMLWIKDFAGISTPELSSSQKDPDAQPTISEDTVMDFPEDFKITITPEMVATFMTEAEEQLETVESSLLGLEKNLQDKELLDSAFRGVHTLKGNCGLFNYSDLEKTGSQL